MAVSRKAPHRAGVAGHIAAHPPMSNLCIELARAIHPVAVAHDPDSHALELKPTGPRARYVVPKDLIPTEPWIRHVTTAVEQHCVDALTGVDGTAAPDYLDAHFEYADAIRVSPYDLGRP